MTFLYITSMLVRRTNTRIRRGDYECFNFDDGKKDGTRMGARRQL